MYFQIKQIIIWPKNKRFQPRHLIFETGKVNIISGASKTGKSAIIPIIDYCLGSEKCTIPVNTIRNACGWFGVVIQTTNGEKLYARREPGEQQATGDMFVLEGLHVDIPDSIVGKNTNVESVKQELNELAGLTSLDFDIENQNSGFKGRPSFRDLSSFVFQPQNIIANPNVLFYKTDTYEHREKLKNIFPYVLNAITAQLLAKQHELFQLRKELRKKESELNVITQVSEHWLAEIQSKAREARELGLIREPIDSINSRDHLVDLLISVVSIHEDEINVTSKNIGESVQELINLQKEDSSVSIELSGLKKRFSEMSALKENAKQYGDSLQIQQERLKLSEWLINTQDAKRECPLCGNFVEKTTDQLTKLSKSLKKIEQAAGSFNNIPIAFDRELQRVEMDITTNTEKLKAIRIRRNSLEKSSDDAKKQQYESLKISRFIGNLEQAIQTYSQIGKDSDLTLEINELNDHIRAIENEISEQQIKAKVRRALESVNLNASKLLPELDAEQPFAPISLSIEELTVSIKNLNREDYLWEIGSGSNWLSYHIAVTLGLQEYFLRLKSCPVPSFVVYDQPSQVYFPIRLADSKKYEPEIQLGDEDVQAVRKVFKVLSSTVTYHEGRLQIIVLDHAGEDVWGGLSNIVSVEVWRGGRKLVPDDWITDAVQ